MTLKHLAEGDNEDALLPLCAALDATAERENPKQKKVGIRFKAFVEKSRRVIFRYSFPGIKIEAGRFAISTRGSGIKAAAPLRPDSIEIDELVYKAIRCDLVHGCRPHPDLVITDRIRFGNSGTGKIYFPLTMVFGLVMAVVAARSNAKEQAKPIHSFQFGGVDIDLNRLWGDENSIVALADKVPTVPAPKPRKLEIVRAVAGLPLLYGVRAQDT